MRKIYATLGTIVCMFMLVACGDENKDSALEELTLDDFKSFISEEKTGFLLKDSYGFSETGETEAGKEVDKKNVEKALENQGLQGYYFDYTKNVAMEFTTEQLKNFRFEDEVGTDQSNDTLGFYENGYLISQFEFPKEWTPGKIDDLNTFVSNLK